MKKLIVFMLAGLLLTGCSGQQKKTEENLASDDSISQKETTEQGKSETTVKELEKLSGLPSDLNSMDTKKWSNVVGDSEYYVNENQQIVRRKTDGSGESVVYEDCDGKKVWALPEGLLFIDGESLWMTELDGSDPHILDEEISSGLQINDEYIAYCKPDTDRSLEGFLKRGTMEKIEVPESLAFEHIELIDGDRFYYLKEETEEEGEEGDWFCSCNLDGTDEIKLMSLPDTFAYNFGVADVTIVNGDFFLNDSFSDVLYKFPAGTSEATEDMKFTVSEGREISGCKIRNEVMYCSEWEGYEASYFKLDLDGNYLGDCTEEEFSNCDFE